MTLLPARHASDPLTFGDLDAMPDDGGRWELIDGSPVVTPAPSGGHQCCAGQLFGLLHDACPPGTVVLPAPYDWRSEATGESFQPDVLVIRRGDFDPGGPLRATPLLVAEIVSPRGQFLDRALRRARYEALAVPAYWIIDPAAPSLTRVHSLLADFPPATCATRIIERLDSRYRNLRLPHGVRPLR